MQRILCCLAHVYSQLRGKWPNVPVVPPAENRGILIDDASFDDFTTEDIKGAINHLVEHYSASYPWLVDWCRERDAGGSRLADAVYRHRHLVRAEGASYITYADQEYPPLLRHIADPPIAITVAGSLDLLKKPALAIIGSRKASAFALQESFHLARQLAAQGFVIVSGGALGCDIAAHQGAIATSISPAPTVCVFAGGLTRLFPAYNQHVFDRIRLGGGVFLSERLWWEGALPRDFATRNRIIAGMSAATCVMQAAKKSGALLTAKHSLNQGREVLVLNHPPEDVRADGSRWLVDDGAVTVFSAADLASRMVAVSERFSRSN